VNEAPPQPALFEPYEPPSNFCSLSFAEDRGAWRRDLSGVPTFYPPTARPAPVDRAPADLVSVEALTSIYGRHGRQPHPPQYSYGGVPPKPPNVASAADRHLAAMLSPRRRIVKYREAAACTSATQPHPPGGGEYIDAAGELLPKPLPLPRAAWASPVGGLGSLSASVQHPARELPPRIAQGKQPKAALHGALMSADGMVYGTFSQYEPQYGGVLPPIASAR